MFMFTVTFNQNGELIELVHDSVRAEFPNDFVPVSTPLADQLKDTERKPKPIIEERIPIDLELLILPGDDPCITHNGRRY